VFFVAAAVSALAIAYVAFTHVLASSRAMSPDVRDFHEGFGDRDGLPPSYTAQKQGDLAWSVKTGIVTVEGGGHAGDVVRFTGPNRRWDDRVLAIRFRAPTRDAAEVFLGLERPDGTQRVEAAYVAGPEPFVHLGGDASGPNRAVTATDELKVDASTGDWHSLAFQFSPMYGHVSAFLDGRPITSVPVGWLQGREARAVFGVRLRGDVVKTSFEIDSLSLNTIDWTLPSFDDTFAGEFVDPHRWGIHFPDPDLATIDVHMVKGGGVALDSHVLAMPHEHVPLFLLRTAPFPLRSFRMRAEVTIERVRHASIFIGLMGASAWTASDRVFDVGSSRDDARAKVYVGGAWRMLGGLSFDQGPEIDLPANLVVEMRYDAKEAKGTAWVDGRQLSEHVLDLKPLDIVAIRIGADAYKPDGEASVVVRRILLEHH